MELRQRGYRSNQNQQMERFQVLENPTCSTKDEVIRNQKCLSAIPTTLVTSAVLLILNVFVYYMDNKLPSTVETNSMNDGFVAQRAMSTLIKLANLGERPVGSDENEKLAFNLFKTEIKDIMNALSNVNEIKMFNQKVSGSFPLDMNNLKYMLSYENLQNVVVKLDPKKGINDAVLLNCHFDSVPGGPGVSDNGVNCAVMVEILRILAKSPDLIRPIIFLFNGGEEIILQASHGFITQHPWSQNAKYIINLDSCGAGGREIMFQTTQLDSYLVDLYAHTVPHPYGQVMGEELFQSGIIPSDTDFRIFRDFGNMSGLDMAHYKNGYVYHTKYDNLDQIDSSVLQNTGENLLELTKVISSHNATKTQKSKYVFFDILGVYMFSYKEMSGAFANFLIVLMSFFSIFLSLRFTTFGMNRRQYSVHLLQTLVIGPCCTFLFSILSCLLVAFLLDLSGCSMSWYTNKINLTVYYATASLAIFSVTIFQTKNESRTYTEWTVSVLNGIQLFWTALLFIGTMAGLRSSYLFMILVIFPSVTSCILGILNVLQRTPKLWIALYTTSLLVPITFVFYLNQIFLSLFVPVTGRFGSNINPDYIVGGLIAMCTYATVGYISPVVTLVKNPRAILASLGAVVLMSMAVVVFSSFGFPYSDGTVLPKTERFDLMHTRRTFYGFDKNVRRNDTGYLIVNWDRHSPWTVAEHVPKMKEAVAADPDCARELLCGSPIVGKLARYSSWIPLRHELSPGSLQSSGTTKTDVVLHDLGDNRRRIEINVTGPERINVYISPYPGTRLDAWSFSGEPQVATRWEKNDVYVIRHSRAGEASVWNFWLEMHSDYGFERKTVNITVAYNWVIKNKLVLNDEFEKFANSFPRWAHVNYAEASVEAFVY
ncbi:Peptidase M28 [Cinara cedri]|uniref:FXNA-like protease n=1 Tax=Cinara cedri TaxID=506608 RepID=A0A5E4NJ26_9HEMI|nr:Peptidase M28 [Cinara cedri]